MSNFMDAINEAKASAAKRKATTQPSQQVAAISDKETSDSSVDTQGTTGAVAGSTNGTVVIPDAPPGASPAEKAAVWNARKQAREQGLTVIKPEAPIEPDWEKVAAQKKSELPDGLQDLSYDKSGPWADYRRQLDDLQAKLDIVDAYNRWSGKGKVEAGSRRESIKCSCPNPSHPDRNPSAWMNRDKNVGYCGGCDLGFDQWDLAAWHYGFPVPSYKSKFNDLMVKAGEDFGIRKPEPTQPVVVTVPEDSVTQVAEGEPVAGPILVPTYDVASLQIPEVSFLGMYLKEALKADVPREFPLFAGLATLSLALGRDFALKFIEEPTHGNLAICLTSPSGSGKGRTTRPATALLRAALPHDETPLSGGLPAEGVRVMQLPGSAEALIDALAEGKTSSPAMVEFEEMQILIGKGAGNSSYKSYIINFADCLPFVSRSSKAYGSNAVVNGFVTFLTATQPQHLRDQFTRRDEGSGLLNRFIFPFGNRVERRAWGFATQDWTAATTELKFVRKWIVTQARNSPDGKAHWIYGDQWDDAARELWVKEFKARCEPDSIGEHGNLLARMDVNMLRLILLFTANGMSNRVRVEFVEMAFKLYDYIKDCALSLAREIRTTELSDSMKAVLEAVVICEKKNSKPATRREMSRTSKLVDQMNDEEFAKVVQRLMNAKMLHHVLTKSKTGRGRTGNAYTSDMSIWKDAPISITEAPPEVPADGS